jgi:translation initiation factor IF-2
MASTNVAKFAAELRMPADLLLEQLRSAGVRKTSALDELTESDKTALLTALRRAHGAADDEAKKKITITRKQTSEIKQADASGRARTIQVEVRKKRVFVQRDDSAAATTAAAEAAEREAAQAAAAARELEEQAENARQAAELRAAQEALEAGEEDIEADSIKAGKNQFNY